MDEAVKITKQNSKSSERMERNRQFYHCRCLCFPGIREGERLEDKE